jgi:hypothetical protein
MRCSRRSVKSTATNSTVANFLPEQAREPSENGRNVPLAGLRIPCADVVPESLAEPVDSDRDDLDLRMNGCGCSAAKGERSRELGEGGVLSEVFSDLPRGCGEGAREGARLGSGVIRGASPSPPSMIQREGSHLAASSPQTLGLEWTPVPLIEIRVPCGITYVWPSKTMGWSVAAHLFVMPVGVYIRTVSDCRHDVSVGNSIE